MLLKTLVKPKERLVTITADATLEDALKVLEDSGFRCIPILDETGHIFRGNIYKMHIYRHKSRGGDMSLPVTTLLKKCHENDSSRLRLLQYLLLHQRFAIHCGAR